MIIRIFYFAAIIFILTNGQRFFMYAQQLEMKWAIEGIPAAALVETRADLLSNFLFNSDDIPDIGFFVTDQKGNPVLIIQDGLEKTKTFIAPLPPYGPTEDGWPLILGYLDLDGIVDNNNRKEIILAEKIGNRYINPVVIHSNDNYTTVNVESFAANSVVVAAGDINGDGQAEIAVFDPDAKEVQIWGY